MASDEDQALEQPHCLRPLLPHLDLNAVEVGRVAEKDHQLVVLDGADVEVAHRHSNDLRLWIAEQRREGRIAVHDAAGAIHDADSRGVLLEQQAITEL